MRVTDTGSLSGQATPYVPFFVSSAVTCRNSGQLQGFAGVGILTPEASRSSVLAIRTLGSWRKGTPYTPPSKVVVAQDCWGMSSVSRSGSRVRRSAR